MKANADKCHLLLSTNGIFKIVIDGSEFENSSVEKLLGVNIDSKLSFHSHVSMLCDKANPKLHALARISPYMTLEKKKMIMKAFISSQFGYSPLVWMTHSRSLNNSINRIHERSLRIVYDDQISTFDELLDKDNSVSIHHRNIQNLAIELYKVKNDLAPEIIKELFALRENS